MTLKVQVPFPGTWVPLQVSLLTLKSPDATTLVTPSAFILGLLKVIVFPVAGNLHRLLTEAQVLGRIGRLYDDAFARETDHLRTVGGRVGERQNLLSAFRSGWE